MLVDRETFAKILEAEPTVTAAPDVLGKLVVQALGQEALNPLYAVVISADTGVFSMLVKDLARRVGQGDVTPAAVGRVVRELGLRSVRTREGYRLFWNRKQLNLLKAAFGITPLVVAQ